MRRGQLRDSLASGRERDGETWCPIRRPECLSGQQRSGRGQKEAASTIHKQEHSCNDSSRSCNKEDGLPYAHPAKGPPAELATTMDRSMGTGVALTASGSVGSAAPGIVLARIGKATNRAFVYKRRPVPPRVNESSNTRLEET